MGKVAQHLRAVDEEQLVEACLAGDERAWAELVDRYGRLVLAIARRQGLQEQDADDVSQWVFAALLDQLPRLRRRTGLAKWFITTTSRQAWRHRRAQPARPEVTGDGVSGSRDALEDLERIERQHAVRLAVRRLDERCARLLEALYLEPIEPSYDQLAVRLGMPRGSIGPTRRRCLARLIEALGDDEP